MWKLLAFILTYNNSWLGLKLYQYAKKTPYFHLGDYMERYWLFRTPWINARFHLIKRPDAGRHLHDHPFWFKSIILKGFYGEQVLGSKWINHYRVGDINHCDPHQFHAIVGVNAPCLTLVFHGPRLKKSWGFLVNGKRVHHSDYEGDV